MKTAQIDFWAGNFGKEYTDRNPQNLKEWDELYLTNYGITKLKMNEEFLSELPKEARILEVGCNIGLQLLGLQAMGFTNLYGVELQPYAVEKAKMTSKGINMVQGSGFDIPFKDSFFDVVFTAGVLIHIEPKDLPVIMKEIIRCSRKYIWGFEYYSAEPKEVKYRGNDGFLWKMNYAQEFLKIDEKARIIKEKIYPFISANEKGNEDIMYLIEIDK